jgi:mannosyltransferase OCH1-like enzyme
MMLMKQLIVFLGTTFFISSNAQFIVPSFDDAMSTKEFRSTIYSPINDKEIGISGCVLMNFFKTMYAVYRPDILLRSKNIKIPKIIHQIWIGKDVPIEFKQFVETWKKYHPDWEYRLWTQDDIASMQLRNRRLVEMSRNPGEISDIMRYEILYQYGGVYVDMDFECLRSLEPFHYLYDFYIGIQPLDSALVQLGIGLIGSVPGHPVLAACIEGLEENWKKWEKEPKATARTGPIYCTKMFYAHACTEGRCDVALPPTYFYPLRCQQIEYKPIEWLEKGAFAVHHWAKTWLMPSFRRPEFRSVKNY